jgi:hypothetical protein
VTSLTDPCQHLLQTLSIIKRTESLREWVRLLPSRMRARIMWPLLKTIISCNHNLSSTKIVMEHNLILGRALRIEEPKAQWVTERAQLVVSETKLQEPKNNYKILQTTAISSSKIH